MTAPLSRYSGLLRAPALITSVLGVGRVLLIMFGARYWLIGTTAAYFVYVAVSVSRLAARDIASRL